MQRRIVVQQQRELVQLSVAETLRFDRFYGGKHVIAIVSGTAMSLPDEAKLLGRREPSGILHVAAIDHVSKRTEPLAGFVCEPHRTRHFAIDVGGLLAAAQIVDRFLAPACRDAEGDAAAGAAAVEAKHEAGLF